MDSVKICGFLIASCFLRLTLLGVAAAGSCSCPYIHPQADYCRASFVIRAQFLGHSRESPYISRYEIKTTKVYKGSETMQELRFLSTIAMASLCGYKHQAPFGEKEYIIAGTLASNTAQINRCSFIQLWAQLSPQQQSDISENYSKGCHCQIKACYSKPCSVKNTSQCTWDESSDFKNMICLPDSKTPASCSWQTQNS